MRKFLFTVSVILSGTSLNAQKLKIGIKGSLGRTALETVFADDPHLHFESKGRLAIRVSGIVEYYLNNRWAVQGEIAPSLLGGRFIYDEDGTEMINKIRLQTLNFPVMVKYYPFQKLNIHAGADFGFLIEAESGVSRNVDHGLFIGGDFFQDLLSGKTDLGHNIKTFSVNPFVGVEYNLNNGLFMDARYTFGLYDIAKNKHGEGFETLKNSYLLMGIGYKFKKK
ncbi:hypothetical protein B0A69_16200 [Chryseobacterium shigense]|uniref:Outer membrane protein beta-barrel domain-containing protein n=1 Tax=Chryseobacterium shigense TaxID=297244 RepID=A0A1N7HWK4_9FLAO|nr:porin family protein [Chryseobacterium shigense]PQA91963.1 hypothetical protein B0A69_16200 [Chryseobacterium shigense]SIS29108.1 Outer membrane protein beta-barrel domain-containing protein [Chryseobacterium shigense]